MDIIVKKIVSKDEEDRLIKAVKFLVDHYKEELGDTMDFKISLLSEVNTIKYLIRHVSDDPNTFLCLLLSGGISYGFWLVDESFDENGMEISISRQFDNLKIIETNIVEFKQLIEKAI